MEGLIFGILRYALIKINDKLKPKYAWVFSKP